MSGMSAISQNIDISYGDLFRQIENREISFDLAGPIIENGTFNDDQRLMLTQALSKAFTSSEEHTSCTSRAWSFITRTAASCTEACASGIFRFVLHNPLHSAAAAATAVAGGLFGAPVAIVVGGGYVASRIAYQRYSAVPAQRVPTDEEIEAELQRAQSLIKDNDQPPTSKDAEARVKEACEFFELSKDEFFALWGEKDPSERFLLAGQKLRALHGHKDEDLEVKRAEPAQAKAEVSQKRHAEVGSHLVPGSVAAAASSLPSMTLSAAPVTPAPKKPKQPIDLRTIAAQRRQKTLSANRAGSSAASSSASARASSRADSVFAQVSASSAQSSASASSSGRRGSSYEIIDGFVVHRGSSPVNKESSSKVNNSNIHGLN